ncbi:MULTISPECIES: hypothetical protein [Brevibacillus]|nr:MULTISPECIES: hypothetical protein [Brevibacillus]MBU8714249.1 hypothetical protein [Brevibacillus parabrevis]MED2253369.1 hypothetical protein [Brevibacillus parabrevis]NRQ55839.1 hypothetical protein [Brevibacillus sp. HD1.4A]WDV94248.1 hypothetical protein PSE45_21805 [Brevibacillus parabrevis]
MTLKTVFHFFLGASVGIPKSFRGFRLFPRQELAVVGVSFKENAKCGKAYLGSALQFASSALFLWRGKGLIVMIESFKKHRNMTKSLLENGCFMQPVHGKTCLISALDFSSLINHTKAMSDQSLPLAEETGETSERALGLLPRRR